jgi:hypothetical protein
MRIIRATGMITLMVDGAIMGMDGAGSGDSGSHTVNIRRRQTETARRVWGGVGFPAPPFQVKEGQNNVT